MDKYIGTKIIQAEPAPAPTQMGEYAEGTDGFKVVYEDGYTSWSPTKVFVEAYRPVEGMSFGLAFEALKKGMAVRLPQWSSDVVIKAQFPDEHSKMTAPYLYVESNFGRVPWKETMIELFSDDWQIVE
jgi:hypothetical protein